MADVATASTAAGDESHKARPDKPDEEKYKADLAKAEKDHEAAVTKFNNLKSKLDSARPGKDSPANNKYKELLDQLKEIRTKQSSNKTSRAAQQEKFNATDTQVKALIKQQNESRTRIGFKSADEIDRKVKDLTAEVDSGRMNLVDEKKNLAEISRLNKVKKGFPELDELQKQIDKKRAENSELRKTFDNPESRALSQKYEDIQKELDDIKATREDTNKNFDTLKAEKDAAYNEQNVTYANKKRVKDDYYQARRTYKEYEDQLYQQRRERQQAERDQFMKEKRRRIAEEKLEEASEPAFLDQIRTAEGLIIYFDPSAAKSDEDKGPGEFAASAQRTVDESGFKGMKVMKKEEEDFFPPSGGKKKGKGKKGAATGPSAPESGKLNMNVGIIEQLGKVGVDPPSTQGDVPGIIEKLKEKLAKWKEDQDSQTKKNVEKAQKEIEDLEKQATETPAPSSSQARTNSRRREDRGKKETLKDSGKKNGVSTEEEVSQGKEAIAGVTNELKDASIEDKEAPAVEV